MKIFPFVVFLLEPRSSQSGRTRAPVPWHFPVSFLVPVCSVSPSSRVHLVQSPLAMGQNHGQRAPGPSPPRPSPPQPCFSASVGAAGRPCLLLVRARFWLQENRAPRPQGALLLRGLPVGPSRGGGGGLSGADTCVCSGDLWRPGVWGHLPAPAHGELGAVGRRVCPGGLLQEPLRWLPPHGLAQVPAPCGARGALVAPRAGGGGGRGRGSVLGSAHPPRCCGLFQEGERAAPRAAAPHPPAPPGGPVQAGSPAEGAGAHGPGGCPASRACAARPAPMRPRRGGAAPTTHFPPCRAERP